VWIVDKPLKYWSELLNCLIVVPPDYEMQSESIEEELTPKEPTWFETDFASVPRLPVLWEMWGDRAHREAVLHDWLYRKDSVPCVAKEIADGIFLEAMKSTGKPWHISYPMYWGVKLGGFTAYHKKNVADKL
jgi:hypothetical protein